MHRLRYLSGILARTQAQSLSAGYVVEAQIQTHPRTAVSGPAANPITINCRLIQWRPTASALYRPRETGKPSNLAGARITPFLGRGPAHMGEAKITETAVGEFEEKLRKLIKRAKKQRGLL
jgi:hypothetical protein